MTPQPGEMRKMDKIREYLLRDIGNEMESGRAMYLVRVTLLGELVYFALFSVVLLLFRQWKGSALPLLCFVISLIIFRGTYHRSKTEWTLPLFYLLSLFWIVIAIVLFGWDCGIQHLLFVLLVLIFTTSYSSMSVKIPLGLMVYAVRMGLYFYTLSVEPFLPFPSGLNHVMQFLDTTMVYLLLILIMSVFASDTLRAESRLANANRKLNNLADTDPLTKLPNRRYVLRHIEECISNSSDPICPTVAIGDIDFFKKVNDTYGHEAGDRVLEILSELFQKTMEPYGLCARWGGEEFLFFFEHLNLDNAFYVLNDLLEKIRLTVIPFGEQQIKVTMTFGVEDALLKRSAQVEIPKQVDSVIQKADKKLYMGKQQGRNQIVA